MAFSDTFKGKKGTIFLIGGAGGLVLFLWYKHSQSQSAAATATPTATSATGTDPFPPDGTTGDPSDPNSIDPNTGITYGDEGSSGGSFGTTGFGGGFGGFPGPVDPGGNPPPGPGPGTFTSNAQWAQYVEQQLAGIIDPGTLSAAIGFYLAGLPVTSDQASLVNQAVAIGGYPPVSGPQGFPPSIHTSGGGGGGKVKVPNVVGQNWMGAIHQLQAAGLKPSPSAKPSNAKDPITGQNPKAGTSVAKGATVTISSPKR